MTNLSVPTVDEIITVKDREAIMYQKIKTTETSSGWFSKRMNDLQMQLIRLRHRATMDDETRRRADLVLAGEYTGRPV